MMAKLAAVRWQAMSAEPVNVGVYGCTVLELHCRQDALIAFTLELVETVPVLGQALRAEEETFDFAAVLIQDDSRVARRCPEAFLKQRARDGRWLPLSWDIRQDVFVGPPRGERSVNEKSVSHRGKA